MTSTIKPGNIARLFDFVFDRLPRIAIAILLIAMIAVNFANVFGRHVFGEAIFWAEEIMKLLMVWAVYLGAVSVTYNCNHLRMDLFSTHIPKPYSIILNGFTFAVFLFVLSYIALYSWQVLQIMNMTGRVSDAANYPITIQHGAVFAGLLLMVAAAITSWRVYFSGVSRGEQ